MGGGGGVGWVLGGGGMGGLMMKAKAYTPAVQRYVWEVGVGLGGCWGVGGWGGL